MAHSLFNKHIISIPELTRNELELIVNTAAKLKAEPNPELLKNKVVASCFFEPSTRTRLSFETAVQRLGGTVIGETVIAATADLFDFKPVILRQSEYRRANQSLVDAEVIQDPDEAADPDRTATRPNGITEQRHNQRSRAHRRARPEFRQQAVGGSCERHR